MDASFLEVSTLYTGPDLTDEMIRVAEERLGYPLPESYVRLLLLRNGGRPRRRCFRTTFTTSWALDHIQIEAIRGIGGTWGIDTPGPLCSAAMIQQWGYPSIGIVICEMPSAGHDAVMLDYSQSGNEPAVAYVDEDRVPRTLAPSFQQFLDGLESCEGLDP
jgi:hypothetical protein